MAARKKAPATPSPVAVTTICSVCGLGWELHGTKPTTEDCIRLLKAELAARPVFVPQPYIIREPYRRPWYGEGPNPLWRQNMPTITCSTTANETSKHGGDELLIKLANDHNVAFKTPKASYSAVSASL